MLPKLMTAVLLTQHGGLEALSFRNDVARPDPKPGEVLVKVAAAGVNNTDINTRTGWYSKEVTSGTGAGDAAGFDLSETAAGTWSGAPMPFPRIQGADVCGNIVAVGVGVDPSRIGARVILRPMPGDPSGEPYMYQTLGSESDGGFAQFCTCRADEAFTVECDWSDVELASIPCAYSTAENMLDRANVGAETVLITGASGGVGSAALQLAKRRGARVIAICAPEKMQVLRGWGADQVIARGENLISVLGENAVDVVIDLVGGADWPVLLDVLRRGGRYATAGAIGGPMVTLDLRTLYLKDQTLFGSTYQTRAVFVNLVGYIERGEIRPLVSKTYPLDQIALAQQDFMAKRYPGKLVLVPPPVVD